MKKVYLSFEDAVAREVEKIINDFERIVNFANRSVSIQNEAYDVAYADRKFEFSSAVLKAVGAPQELYSPVVEAHEKAISEIMSGVRTKPVKKTTIKEKDGTIIRSVKDTGNIEIVIRVSKEHLKELLETEGE